MGIVFGNPEQVRKARAEEIDQPYSAGLVETARTVIKESPLDAMLSVKRKADARGGKQLSQEFIHDESKRLGLKIEAPREGMSEGEFNYLIERQRDNQYSQMVQANAKSTSAFGMMGHLGVGLVSSLADPTNVALGFVPVVGGAKYAASMNNATRGARAMQALKVGGVEGAVGAAAVEPFVYGALNELQDDYGAIDVAANLFLSTAFSAVMRGGGRAVGDFITGYKPGDMGLNKDLTQLDADVESKTREILDDAGVPKNDQQAIIDQQKQIRDRLMHTSPEYRDAIINAAVTQIMTGRKLNIDELVELGLETDYSVLAFQTKEAAEAARLELDNQFEAKIQDIIAKMKGNEEVSLDMLEKLQNFAAKMQEEILDIELAKNEFEIDRALKRGVSLKDIPDLSSIKAKQRMISEALDAIAGNDRLTADRLELQRLNEMYENVTPEAVLRIAKDLHNKMRLDKRTNQRAAEWVRAQHEKGATELAEPEASVKAQEAFEEAKLPEGKGEALKEAEAALEAVKATFDERYKNAPDAEEDALEAARIREEEIKEAEAAKAAVEKALKEAEAAEKAKAEAEQEALAKEAARAKAEADAKAKADAEKRAKTEVEKRARAEARAKANEEVKEAKAREQAAKAKAEAEARQAKKAEEEKKRLKAEEDKRIADEKAKRDAMTDEEREHYDVEKGLEGKSLIEGAKWLSENHPKKDQRIIAERVWKKLIELESAGVDLKLKVVHLGDRVPSRIARSGAKGAAHGKFGPKTKEMTVYIKGADITGDIGVKYEVALHEMVHAVTQTVINFGQMVGSKNTRYGKIVNDLHTLREVVVRHFNDKVKRGEKLSEFEQEIYEGRNNAAQNLHELVAWGLTNPDMQKMLNGIRYESISAWSKFVDIIAKILGVNRNSALEKLLKVTDDLMGVKFGDFIREARAEGFSLMKTTDSDFSKKDLDSIKKEADAIIKEAEEESAALLEAVNCALRSGV